MKATYRVVTDVTIDVDDDEQAERCLRVLLKNSSSASAGFKLGSLWKGNNPKVIISDIERTS